MDEGPSWFYVYDVDADEWFSNSDGDWGPYSEAAEFSRHQDAVANGKRHRKAGHTVIVLGDLGVIEE